MVVPLLRFVLVSALACTWEVARAADPPNAACEQSVPLPEDERRQITLSLLERYPLLASSPGVKAADTLPADCHYSNIAISVIFYPHSQQRGIEEAYEALCGREYGGESWACDDVTIRRYLQLSSQAFKVRLEGRIASDTALAVIEASRRGMKAGLIDAADVLDTAIIVRPFEEDGYLVTWGSTQRSPKLTMLAQLAKSGNPENPSDWHASVFRPAVR